jgi:predicted nucleic acid-binding protein
MAMMDDRAVLVDTNVLLAATVPLRSLHRAALTVLNQWPNQGTVLAASVQVFREYLAVATRPAEANGLGLPVSDALSNVDAFLGRMRLLAEGESTWTHLRELIAHHRCQGKQIHDANVVATALSHGIAQLVTANVGDFLRFSPKVKVIDLATVEV